MEIYWESTFVREIPNPTLRRMQMCIRVANVQGRDLIGHVKTNFIFFAFSNFFLSTWTISKLGLQGNGNEQWRRGWFLVRREVRFGQGLHCWPAWGWATISSSDVKGTTLVSALRCRFLGDLAVELSVSRVLGGKIGDIIGMILFIHLISFNYTRPYLIWN